MKCYVLVEQKVYNNMNNVWEKNLEGLDHYFSNHVLLIKFTLICLLWIFGYFKI